MLQSKLRSVQLRELVTQWNKDNPGTSGGTEFSFFVQAGNEQVKLFVFGRDRLNKLKTFLEKQGWVIYAP